MNYEPLLRNGVIIIIMSISGIFIIKNIKDHNRNSLEKDDGNWTTNYLRMYDKFYFYPLIVLLFIIGMSLVYNGLAIKNGWPVFPKFLFQN